MTATPDVSVLVPCTRPALIEGIAWRLGDQTGPASCELVVVGDVDGLDPAGWPVPATLVPCSARHPNARRAIALDRSTGAVVAFLDDDALPEPGWLDVAASLAPDERAVWTGPELPVRTSRSARLARAVATSLLAEAYRGHVTVEDGPAAWFEVPFCNLVTTRTVADQVGPPPTDVAWDLDDFAWCRRAHQHGVAFANRPALLVRHDRYPDSIVEWIRMKVQDRARTGEKLVRYPDIYLRVPGAVVAAAAPLAGAAVVAAAGRRRRALLQAGGAAYLGALAVEAWRCGQRGRGIAAFVGVTAVLHVTTLSGMQVGMVRGAAERLAGRPDRYLLADRPGT